MAYGDALTFTKENIGGNSCKLQEFTLKYDEELSIKKPAGQYSYITELMLILIKCLIDDREQLRVKVDYTRFYDELRLWRYYRHGNPSAILARLKIKNYYNTSAYWGDKLYCGINRVIAIFLGNNNYQVAEREIYKNLIYFHRHPEVILNGLLIARAAYIILMSSAIDEEKLLQGLKDYLIDLKLAQINEGLRVNYGKQYRVEFEKKKIKLLMDIDRYKLDGDLKDQEDRKLILMIIHNYYRFVRGEGADKNYEGHKYYKEIMSTAYGFLGISGIPYNVNNDSFKDMEFIHQMGRYLHRLRKYELQRSQYARGDEVNIFNLRENSTIKHPILNNIKILERNDLEKFISLKVETKSVVYTFIKDKNKAFD